MALSDTYNPQLMVDGEYVARGFPFMLRQAHHERQ
jgi:hypothetical protein